jgi:hypothetical protein
MRRASGDKNAGRSMKKGKQQEDKLPIEERLKPFLKNGR